jgi:hypothetical protein
MSPKSDHADVDGHGASASDSHPADRQSREFTRPAAPNPTAALQVDVCFPARTGGNIVPLT